MTKRDIVEVVEERNVVDDLPAPEADKIHNFDSTLPEVDKRSNKSAKKIELLGVVVDHLPVSTNKKSINALLQSLKNHKKTAKKSQLFEDDPQLIYMQIAQFRIPTTPKMELRVSLQHSLSVDRDACLIVKNIKTGKKKDIDRTINHYNNLLKDMGSLKVVPIAQLCDDHKSYEEKGKFSRLYDTYLVDGRMLSIAQRTLGIRFSRSGNHLIPVKMDTKGLKDRLEAALSKSVLTVHSNGDTFTMKIGYSTMTLDQLSDNVLSALSGLCQEGVLPGGFDNIRAVHVKTARSMALPVYLSRKTHNSVVPPIKKVKLPKNYRVVEGELSTVIGGIVSVNPEGDVHLRRELTNEDRMMLAGDDSDAFVDDTKLELASDSESEDEKPEIKSKTSKRKMPAANESDDDEEVEAAEENYINEMEGGSDRDDSDKEEKSADKAVKQKKRKSKTSKKPRNTD